MHICPAEALRIVCWEYPSTTYLFASAVISMPKMSRHMFYLEGCKFHWTWRKFKFCWPHHCLSCIGGSLKFKILSNPSLPSQILYPLQNTCGWIHSYTWHSTGRNWRSHPLISVHALGPKGPPGSIFVQVVSWPHHHLCRWHASALDFHHHDWRFDRTDRFGPHSSYF